MGTGLGAVAFIAGAIILSFGTPQAQVIESRVPPTSNGNIHRTIIGQKPGVMATVLIPRNGRAQVDQIDMTKQVNIIVEFKGEPLFLRQMRNPSSPTQLSAYLSGTVLFPPVPDRIYCSDFSQHFWFTGAQFANDRSNVHDVQFDSIAGLNRNISLTNRSPYFF